MKLLDLLNKCEFSRVDHNGKEKLDWNSRTVRIYMGESETIDPFFELGCGRHQCVQPKVSDFVRSDVLDREVQRYYCEEDLGILFIFLKLIREDEE